MPHRVFSSFLPGAGRIPQLVRPFSSHRLHGHSAGRFLIVCGLALLLLGGGAQPACASYIVSTFASASSGSFINGTASYNVGGHVGAFFSMTDTTIFPGTTDGASGTPDTTGLATATLDQSTADVSAAVTGFGDQLASASAAANLATGILQSSFLTTLGGGGTGAGANSVAQFSDVIHYTIAGATDSTVTDVLVHFNLDGGIGVASGTGEVNWSETFGGGGFTASAVGNNSPCASPLNACFLPGYPVALGNWVSTSFNTNDVGNIAFTGVYALMGASGDVAISGSLQTVGGQGDVSVDYFNTSQFGLTLPSNVTFTSDSGVFLTDQPASAPEPGMLLAVGLGLAGIGLARRKGRAR